MVIAAIRDWFFPPNLRRRDRPEHHSSLPQHVAAQMEPEACGALMPGSSAASGWTCTLALGHDGLHGWQTDYGLELRQLWPHQDVYAWLPKESRWVLVTSIPGDEPYPLYETESVTDRHLPGECEHHRPSVPESFEVLGEPAA